MLRFSDVKSPAIVAPTVPTRSLGDVTREPRFKRGLNPEFVARQSRIQEGPNLVSVTRQLQILR